MKRILAALASGALFGIGLTVAQMVNPVKVLDFLDLLGNWDPSLALVMGGGVAVTLVTFRWVLGRERPLLDEQFHLPTRKDIDARLVIGSAIFGLGWGLGGYCPGPAVAAITFGSPEPWLFIPAMLLGSWVAGQLLARKPA